MIETIAEMLNAYRSGAATPTEIVARSFGRIQAHDDPAIFITLRDEKDVAAEAQALERSRERSLPPYGIPNGRCGMAVVGG